MTDSEILNHASNWPQVVALVAFFICCAAVAIVLIKEMGK